MTARAMRSPAEWLNEAVMKLKMSLEKWKPLLTVELIANIQAEAFAAGRKAGLEEAAEYCAQKSDATEKAVDGILSLIAKEPKGGA